MIELQNTSELKSSIEGFNNRQDQTEEKINELQNRSVEINQAEEQKEKRKKMNIA